MKQGYLKYSDERNRRFSIKTEINVQGGKGIVCKKPVFSEGSAHIEHMFESQKKLQQYYSHVEICRAWKQDDSLEFDFIEGELFLNRYAHAVQKEDRKEYEKLLRYHETLICGDSSNQCTFEASERFTEWFGTARHYEGKAGMKYANFDAIAGNIIIRDNQPVFIDYEWTMDFVMPRDLVVFHCIYDGYLHHPEFEQFYPFEQVLKLLEIHVERKALEESYQHFFDYVVSERDGRSYVKDKYQCLKKAHTLDHILLEWEKCANSWEQAVEANKRTEAELEHAKEEWESCAGLWKQAVEANQRTEAELAHAKEEWEHCAKEWKNTVQALEELSGTYHELCGNYDEVNQKYEDLQEKYEEIINSRWWKIADRAHRIFRSEDKS